jgi:hypothetical protein
MIPPLSHTATDVKRRSNPEGHTLVFGDLFCLQGFKVLFQRRIHSTPTARKIDFFVRSVLFFATARIFFATHAKTDQTD